MVARALRLIEEAVEYVQKIQNVMSDDNGNSHMSRVLEVAPKIPVKLIV
jgi:hypothetical protein